MCIINSGMLSESPRSNSKIKTHLTFKTLRLMITPRLQEIGNLILSIEDYCSICTSLSKIIDSLMVISWLHQFDCVLIVKAIFSLRKSEIVTNILYTTISQLLQTIFITLADTDLETKLLWWIWTSLWSTYSLPVSF